MSDASPEMISIFSAALERATPEERAAYVTAACGADEGLRARVEDLLRAHDRATGFLRAPAGPADPEATAPYPAGEAAGAAVGPYKLLQRIGEGGMGEVWMAEQAHPVQRTVALKLLKVGPDGRGVVARFEAERQALALMDHPNIARVYDAGTTPAGRPFFAMELIKGTPITRYCDDHRLTPRERLELFVPVCQAIQHAHQKGVIHRDLKPTNVLVCQYDGRPVPKVIDFGVAKATGQKLTDKTLFTEFGMVVGTPEYMSPEQAELNQLDIDTRSDVYALGVLLYELLTGTTPLTRKRVREGAFLEILRLVREEEPPRPSHRLSTVDALPTIAANRATEPRRLTALLRRELDWVVMKCLEKDRARRYETASGLARDLQRYLADEPVEACPPSAAYRVRKLVRRHRPAVLAAGLVAAALVVGTAVSIWQAVEARAARKQAEDDRNRARKSEAKAVEEAAASEAVTDFFQDDVLGQTDWWNQAARGFKPDPGLTVKEALDRAAERIGERFRDRPREEAAIRNAIGCSYLGLGEARIAIDHLERAVALAAAALGPEHVSTWTVNGNLGFAYQQVGRHDDADRVYRQTLEVMTAAQGPTNAQVIALTVRSCQNRTAAGRSAQAIPQLEQIFQTALTKLGPGHEQTVMAASTLARVYQDARRLEDAVSVLRRLRGEQVKALGPHDRAALKTTGDLAFAVLLTPGGEAEAVALRQEALTGYEAAEGADGADTLIAVNGLAEACKWAGQTDRAIELYRRAVVGMERRFGPRHWLTLEAMSGLANTYRARPERNADAVALMEQVVEARKASLGPDHGETLAAMGELAGLHLRGGRLADAVPLYESIVARRKGVKESNESANATRGYVRDLGQAYRRLGQWDKAAALCADWLGVFRSMLRPGHPHILDLLTEYAEAVDRSGSPVDVIRELEAELASVRQQYAPEDWQTLRAMDALAQSLDRAGRWAEAAAIAKQVVDARVKQGRDDPNTLSAMCRYAAYALRAGRWAEAEAAEKDHLESVRIKHGPDGAAYAVAMRRVSHLLINTRREREAILVLEGLVKRQKAMPKPDHLSICNTLHELGRAYHLAGRYADAERALRESLEWRKKLSPGSTDLAHHLANLGETLLALKQFVDAETVLRESVVLFEKPDREEWKRARARNLYGAALAGLGKADEAERLLVDGYEGMSNQERKLPAPWKPYLAVAGERVVRFYESTNQPDKARVWRERLGSTTPTK